MKPYMLTVTQEENATAGIQQLVACYLDHPVASVDHLSVAVGALGVLVSAAGCSSGLKRDMM